MNAPHKFLFEQSFDLPDPPRGPRKPAPAPPPEPSFTKAELEAVSARALGEGRAAALAEAAQATEARVAAALAGVESALGTALAARAADAEQAQRRCLETLRGVLRKLAPALCRMASLIELEAMVDQCLREAVEEPRVVLRVGDEVFDAVRERLGAITGAAGFAGKVVLLADEGLGAADARIEWAEGGAERDSGRLIDDIDAALARALDAISFPGASPSEEKGHE
jgi:flagellar assembly protein FliH